MKKLHTLLAGAFGAAFSILAVTLLLAFGTPDDQGPTFADYTRTNVVSFPTNNIGAPEQIFLNGTNYTGMTTNIAFLHFNGVGGTNTLGIVDGLIVNIQ